jgi:hypothetical protein
MAALFDQIVGGFMLRSDLHKLWVLNVLLAKVEAKTALSIMYMYHFTPPRHARVLIGESLRQSRFRKIAATDAPNAGDRLAAAVGRSRR